MNLWNFCLLASLLFLPTCAEQQREQSKNTEAELMSANNTTDAQQDSTPKDTINRLAEVPSSAEDWTGLYHPKYLKGDFKATEHPDFAVVPKAWTDGDGTYYLHTATIQAFGAMRKAALQDGVELIIVSAFRNFSRQKAIWEAKWNGKRLLEGKENAKTHYPDPANRARAILRYSSMPGTSRHHWGTDLDLNRLNNNYFASGEGLKIYEWLKANAATYGFCQPYTAKGPQRPNGYEEEKWHWSYMPLSAPLTTYAAISLQNDNISGFAGAESAPQIKVVENYVLGINQACRQVHLSTPLN